MNLYEQQTANRRRTWVLVAVFVALTAALGLGLDYFVLKIDLFGPRGAASYLDDEPSPPGLPALPYGTAAALLFGFGTTLASFWRGPKMVLAAAHARPADPSRHEERVFLNVAAEMAQAAGLPVPKCYVVPDEDLNAFATGLRPANGHIAVTEGLLKALNREELQGVLSHEMSHIRNLDVRLMTLIAALAGTVALLSDWAGRAFRHGGDRRSGRSSSRDGKGGGGVIALALLVVWILLMILAPILSQLLAMAVSRRREFLADASGAELTRNPGALISALEKIHAAVGPTRKVSQGLAHLCIDDPKGSHMGSRQGFLADLLATHPPIGLRIEALKQMAYMR